MTPKLLDLDPGPKCPEIVRIVVEIPKNSRNKYEYEKELELFRLDRPLYSPLHYPGDYGFIPGTAAEDGDPADVLVLTEEPTFTGCLLEARPIGVLDMVDDDEPDQKILAVPHRDPRYEQVKTGSDIPPHVQREIQHFFTIYKELEGKKTEIRGWGSSKEARKIIGQSRQRYLQQKRAWRRN